MAFYISYISKNQIGD